MNRLLEFVIFVVVVGVLWWALKTILVELAVGRPWDVLAIVAFVIIAVFAFLDYLRAGNWFWTRKPQ